MSLERSLEKNKIVSKSIFLDPRLKKTAFGLANNAENTQKWVIEKLTSIISINKKDDNISEIPATLTLIKSSYSLGEHFNSKLSQVRNVTCPDFCATLLVNTLNYLNCNVKKIA